MNRVTTNIPCSKMLTALLLFLFVGTGMPFTTPVPTGMPFTTPGPMPTGMPFTTPGPMPTGMPSFTTPGSMPMGMPFSAPGFMPTGQAADQNKCQPGEVYCIQSQQCVNLVASERTCDDPTCSYGQEACYDPKSKNLICVNSGTCSYHYVEFHLKTTYDALTDYGTQTDALKERFHKRLATFLSGSTKEIWGMELHHGDGDVILAFKYVKELDVEGMVADGDQVLTDMSDNNIEINYPKMSYPNVICAMDKVLCLSNGTWDCKPMSTYCPKKHVTVTLDADYYAKVGPEPYRSEEDMKRQFSRVLKAPPNAFHGFVVHPGSIIVEFSIPNENVQELLDDPSKLLLYDLSGTPLGILNIEVTSEDDGNDNGGSGGGMFPLPQFSDTCSPDQCTKCGPDQVFCAMTGKCVTPNQPAETCDEDKCQQNEEKCWDSTDGKYFCTPENTCMTSTMSVRFKLGGDYFADVASQKEAWEDGCKTSLALETETTAATFENLRTRSGTIHVKTVVNATNPTTLNAILERLDKIKYLQILGMTYDILPGSMEYGDCIMDAGDNCIGHLLFCPANEVTCFDPAYGSGYCIAEVECTTTSMLATLVLNGDTTNALVDTELFKTEAGIQIPTFLSIVEVEMVDVFINMSTVSASIRVHASLPIDLEGRIESILKVQSSSLSIQGTIFRVESVAFGECSGDPSGMCDPHSFQCAENEETCYNATTGQPFCTSMCSTTSLGVYFEALDVDGVGVTVFLSSLKLPWATALSIDEAYMDMFQVHDIDNGGGLYGVSFELSCDTPAELHIQLEQLKVSIETSTMFLVDGLNVQIIAGSMMLGSYLYSTDDPFNCDPDKVICWERTSGMRQCAEPDNCNVKSMPVGFGFDSPYPSDEEGFKIDFAAALQELIYPAYLNPVDIQDIHISQVPSFWISFLIVAQSPSDLDAALLMIEGFKTGGQISTGSDLIIITPNTLVLGCHDNCEEPQVTCLATEVSCRDITNGQQQCVAFDGCKVISMKVIMALSSIPSGDVEQFKQDLSAALIYWLPSIPSVENMEFDPGTLVASFVVVADSPSSLDAALVILESNRLGGEIPVSSVNIRITFDSLQLGCHDNCEEPQVTCLATEVPCWDRTNGQKECVSIGNCHVNKMKVRMGLDISYPADVNTFKQNLAVALIPYLALTLPDAVKNLQLDQQDDMVVASFLIVAASPVELDIALELILILSDDGGMLYVGTEEISIVLGSLNLGCYDNCDGICLMTEDSCRDMTNGRKQCVAIGDCQVNSLKGSINLEIEFPTDENMFKLNLADALVSYLYPLSPVAVQNLQIHQQDTIIVASFLIFAPSPLELDAAIDMMENLEEIGELIIVNDAIPIVTDSLDFGCHDDCDGICLMTEESCRNRQSGQKQCVAIGECQVNSLKGSMALEISSPIDEYMFKFNLHDALMTYLSLTSPDAVQNLQLYQQGTIIVASFLIVTQSHTELDAAIKLMESLEESGVFIVGEDEIPLVRDSLDFGCHEHCDDQQVSCPTTEMLCVDRRTGSESCTGYGLCRTTSIQVSIAIDGTYPADESQFKQDIRESLISELGLTDVFMGLLNQDPFTATCVIFTDSPLLLRGAIARLHTLTSHGSLPVTFQLQAIGCSNGDCIDPAAQCSMTEDWCPDELTCMADCDAAQSGEELDTFFIDLQVKWDIVPPDIPPAEPISAGNIKAQLQQLEDLIAIQLGPIPIFESLKWISALPTLNGQGENNVRVWIKVAVQKNSETKESIGESLNEYPLFDSEGRILSYTVSAVIKSEETVVKTVFPVLFPFVAGSQQPVNIKELIPESLKDKVPESIRDNFPTRVRVRCNPADEVSIVDIGSNTNVQELSVTEQNGLLSITLVHTRNDIGFVGCDLRFEELTALGHEKIYAIGLFGLPADLTKLAEPSAVSLAESVLQLTEDGGCANLPDELFQITVKGEGFGSAIGDWVLQMIENNESWKVGNGIHLQSEMQNVLVEFIVETLNSRKNDLQNVVVKIDQSEMYKNNELVAKLQNGGSVLNQKGVILDLMASGENFKICPSDDFNGEFHLEITPMFRDSEMPMLELLIQVDPVNDAPVVKDNIVKIIADMDFAYPQANKPGTETVDPAEFSVGSIASALFSDEKDDNFELGLAVLGYIEAETAGLWEYKREDSEWTPMIIYDSSITSNGPSAQQVLVIILKPEDLLRFTPDDLSTTWSLFQAPVIVIMGTDIVPSTEEESVTLDVCSHDTTKLCGPGGTTHFSEAVLYLKVPRIGCDGVKNSGAVYYNSDCPCGVKECDDCMGVAGGDAVIDPCGICHLPADMLVAEQCCNLEYRDLITAVLKEGCEGNEAAEEAMDNLCPIEGETLSPCGRICVDVNDETALSGLDQCGIQCGNDDCLDCALVPHGLSMVNPCGLCKEPDNFYEDCDLNIGNPHPEYQFAKTETQIILDISQNVYDMILNQIDGLICMLSALEPNSNSIDVPVVSKVEHYESEASTVHQLKMTLTATDVEQSVGEFDITCTFGEISMSLSDISANWRTYKRFLNVDLISIEPSTAFIDDNDLVVTLTAANGLINTGRLLCMIPCPDFCVGFISAPGEYLDQYTATCDFAMLASYGFETKLNVYLVLDGYQSDSSLGQSVEFTIKKRPPEVIEAVITDDGCGIIYVLFDRSFTTTATDDNCNSFFSSDFDLSDAFCYQVEQYIEIHSEKVPDSEGYVLDLLPVFYDESFFGSSSSSFATGQVTVESMGMIQPSLSISGPEKIGDLEEYLYAEVEDLGCHTLDLAWTVEALNGDPFNTQLQDKLEALNSRYASLQNDQRFHIDIKASELEPDILYRFTLAWQSPRYDSVGGLTSKNITIDKSKLLKASIYGLSEKVDNRRVLLLTAEVESDRAQFSATKSYEYGWHIEPSLEGKNPSTKKRWLIAANSLKGDTDYIVTLAVRYGAITYQTKKSFKTVSNALITRINNNDNGTTVAVASNDNIILSNAGSYDPDQSTDLEIFFWICKTNFWSESSNPQLEGNFLPCGKIIDNQFQPFTSSGEELSLPADERKMRTDGTLSEIYELIYVKSTRSTTAKIQLNFFTPERKITKPVIRLRNGKTHTAIRHKRLRLKVRCKAETGFIWTSTKGHQNLNIASLAKYPDKIKVSYGTNHNSDKFDKCDLILNFPALDDAAARNILNGQTYKLTITASSEKYEVSETVTIKTYKDPIGGYFSIKLPPQNRFVALETDFRVVLNNWRDPAVEGTARLKCLYYSKLESANKYEPINSQYASSDKPTKFQLPAGRYVDFKARCCSYVSGQCTTVFASDITQFDVQQADIREEDTSAMVVQQMQMAMQIAAETALRTIMNVLFMVQALASSPITPPVAQVKFEVNIQISVVIEAALPDDEESDEADRRSMLRESTELLKQHNDPPSVPKSTKQRVLKTAVSTCVSFTGYGFFGFSRRRRRETVTSQEDAEGMSAEVAAEMLSTIDATFGTSTEGADKTMADLALTAVKQAMLGMCQSYTGDDSSPVDAVVNLVSVRVVKKSMAGTASSQSEMVSRNTTNPAAATYGTDIESHYGQPWECKNDTSSCTDVCLAVAQVVIDFITLTATMEKTPPILHSDIILIELINPETNVEEEVTNLADPVVVTVPTRVADLTNFDLVCMMWIDDDWDDTKCTMGIPFMTGRGQFDVTCSCSELGILGVFQTEKSNTSVFIATTSTTTSQQKPSKSLLSTTIAANCEVTIDAIWETEIGKATKAELISHFTNELVSKTGYVKESFKNVDIRKGSIILSFELQPSTTAGSDTLGQMLASIELLVDSGTMTITNPSGDTLTINANSFTYTEQSSEDGGLVTSASVGAIVGGVIGGIAFIALAAGAAFFVFKKTNLGKSFRPNSPAHVSPHTPDINARSIYHLPPPPSYNSLAPEKQKLYPDTKKWTENELKPWHPNEKHPRFVGNATSLEQGLVPDPEERTPTPVGN